MVRPRRQSAGSCEKVSASQDSQQAIETHQVGQSRGVTNKSRTTPENIVGRLYGKKLKNLRKGKIRRYVEQSPWSFGSVDSPFSRNRCAAMQRGKQNPGACPGRIIPISYPVLATTTPRRSPKRIWTAADDTRRACVHGTSGTAGPPV